MSAQATASWYWNRLRCMSPAEIGHRALRAVAARVERHGWRSANSTRTPDLSRAFQGFVLGGDHISQGPYVAAADDIAAGKLRVFALDAVIGSTPRWNVDPKSGREVPLEFGKTLDYRNEAVVGDIKYLWEPNRHLHLVALAQAWRLTGEQRYVETILRHVESWLDQCPYPLGPNWSSSLEVAIRLINWSIVWQLLGGHAATEFKSDSGRRLRDRWIESIYQHIHFIRNHLSRYSSANNHLIGEVSGLCVGALTWPYWRECRGWANDARQTLETEALRQNADDGVNLEQAISYQQFVLDFLLLAGLAARANGHDFSSAYWKRIESMLEYLASIMDVGGNVAMIGDADDGYVVQMSQEAEFCPYRSLLATGAILFERKDFAAKAKNLDDKTRWLLGVSAEARFREPRPNSESLPVHRSFPDGGYYILGCDFESEREIRAIVDAGPLGYLSIAAHGHADALAFTLSIGGYEVLVDPGTYAYHTERVWRDYFRGTAAHNTLRVDGLDQSVSGGNFMWVHHARVSCRLWETTDQVDRFAGTHDGYERLRDPVTHEREMVFDKKLRRLEVIDTLRCTAEHRAERYWHFAELVDVTLAADGSIEAKVGRHRLWLRPERVAVQAKLWRGEVSPPRGWVSRHFGVKVPTTTVVWTTQVKGTTELRAILETATTKE